MKEITEYAKSLEDKDLYKLRDFCSLEIDARREQKWRALNVCPDCKGLRIDIMASMASGIETPCMRCFGFGRATLCK